MSLRVHAGLWMALIAFGVVLGRVPVAASPASMRMDGRAAASGIDTLQTDGPLRLDASEASSRGLRGLRDGVDAIAQGWHDRLGEIERDAISLIRPREGLALIIAGAVDGMARRRSRRCGLAPLSAGSRAVSLHALVALAFLPAAWAAWLPLDLPGFNAPWAIAAAVAMSFALSRVQGVGATR